MTDSSGPPAASVRTVSVSFDLNRLPSAITALGVALVSSAIVLSAMYSRQHGELDGSNFIMGVLATFGLLGVAAGAHLLVADAERRASLVSWPGAAGIIGAGAMIAVQVNNDRWNVYTAGTVILVISVLSYIGTKAAAFVLTTIAGLALLYVQLFDDVIDLDGDGGNAFMIVGAAILVFVGAVTAVGWLLPKTRVLSAVVVGVGAILAFSALFQFMLIFSTFQAFSSGSDSYDYSGSEPEYGDNPYRDDIKVILAYTVALGLFWALCSVLTGHVAFRLLSVAILVLSIPATTIALVVSHPTWWQVALTAAGALLLGAAGLRLLKTDPPPPAA